MPLLNPMTSRQRFRETMSYGTPDRVPYFEEGIRDEVIKAWRRQGLSRRAEMAEMFPTDRRQELAPDLEPHPVPKRWPVRREDIEWFRRSLDPGDPDRWPPEWSRHLPLLRKNEDEVIMLRVHRGFFLTLGVYDWRRLREVVHLIVDEPSLVREIMAAQGDFAAAVAERVLREVPVDAAVFSEPIGGNDRPLISPRMYEEFVLRSYQPVLDVLRRFRVETVILVTYANARLLVPCLLKWGFNCLWACEVDTKAMDYLDLRREFGRDLRLIGGIDLDALRRGKEAIRREIEDKVPPLVAEGGYVPLADGRVREDVPFENYVYYRRLLMEVTGGALPQPRGG